MLERIYCIDCGTEYEGKYDEDGELVIYDSLKGEWVSGCLECNGVTFETIDNIPIPAYKPDGEELNDLIESAKVEDEE